MKKVKKKKKLIGCTLHDLTFYSIIFTPEYYSS